jgi:hypothetical protein
VTQKGSTRYVSVVQDYQAQGAWKVRTLQSFGPEDSESLARAYQFKANCDAFKEFHDRAVNAAQDREAADEAAKAALIVFGLILGAAAIGYLLSEG